MISTSDILLGGVLPALLAAAALGLVWRRTRRAASSWRTALVMGFIVGLWGIDSQGAGWAGAISKGIRITEARDYLPLIAILAILPDAVAAINRQAATVAWGLRFLLCVLLPWQLLYGSAYLPRETIAGFTPTNAWSTTEAVLWLGGIGTVLFAAWTAVREVAPDERPRLRSLLATLVAVAAAATIAFTGSQSYGQLMGALAAALAGCAIGSFLWKVDRGPDAAAGPLVVIFGALLILAMFFSNLSLIQAGLLLVAMVAGAGWFFPHVKANLPLRCAICAIAAGAVVLWTGIEFVNAIAESQSNPYLNM